MKTMKILSIVLSFLISISFTAVIFNNVVVNDIGMNGSSILQLSSDATDLYFLTNNSLNSYNFQYLKSVYVKLPISMKVYNNIYVHTQTGLNVYDKNLKLLDSFKFSFFDFDFDPDTKTLFLFHGNSLDFLTDFKIFKTFSFNTRYDYFCYDSFNKKIVLAKKNGQFIVIDQILYTINSYNYSNYHFLKVLAFNGKIYFLDKASLLSFDYLIFKQLALKPLWMIKNNRNLFLIFNRYVLSYIDMEKYNISSLVKGVAQTDSTVYFLYQNNFIVNSYGKSYYFVSSFTSLFYKDGTLNFYDPNRGLFRTKKRSKYVPYHFSNVCYDSFKHYVIAISENSLFFLDDDFNLINQVKLRFLPVLLKIDKTNSVAFIVDNYGKVFSYDYSNDIRSSKVNLCNGMKVFMPQIFEYYSFSSNSITIYDSYGKVISTFSTDSSIADVVFSSYFDALFLVTYDGMLYEYDLSLNKVLKVQKVLNFAAKIIAGDQHIYVLDSVDQKVAAISYDSDE